MERILRALRGRIGWGRGLGLLLSVALMALALGAPALATATPGPPYWSSAKPGPGNSGSGAAGVSCLGQLCAFWSGGGDPSTYQSNVFESGDMTPATPTYGGGPTGPLGPASKQVDGAACVSANLCLAATSSAGLERSSNASSSTPTWTTVDLPGSSTSSSPEVEPTVISCPQSSFCVASGADHIWATSDPAGLRPAGQIRPRPFRQMRPSASSPARLPGCA